jgi:hypothetical protein
VPVQARNLELVEWILTPSLGSDQVRKWTAVPEPPPLISMARLLSISNALDRSTQEQLPTLPYA